MKKFILTAALLFGLANVCNASINVDAFVTADNVTIDHLEAFRTTVVDAINSADGSLIQAGSIEASKLDANANPENRWNEAFSDFVYTGLTIPTSASLATTTASGIAYVNGTRVVKDDTAHTYTASKQTWVDLSSNGTYTYQEVAIGASEPTVSTNSIRLARVSSDTTTINDVSDERTTSVTVAIGSATAIADTDADTQIQTQESDDEDIIRFDIGGTEQIVLNDGSITPTTDNDIDLGSSTLEFKDFYLDGVAYIDGGSFGTVSFGTFTDSSGTVVITGIYDQDSMAADSAVHLSTQQSIKAYVDSFGREIFTSSGTFTVPSGVTKVYLTMVGGGGAGGGVTGVYSGGGGGAGASIILYPYTVTPGAAIDVVVGAAAAGASGGTGNNGIASVFDSTVTANGGSGGVGGTADGAGGAGGAIPTNTLAASGATAGIKSAATATVAGGVGGNGSGGSTAGGGGASILGTGGTGGNIQPGNPGTGFGAGGSGAVGVGPSTGGAGTAGIVIVTW